MIVFVTGATAGFGAAIARRFVREGHRVIAGGRRQDRLDALKAELGDALLPVVLDALMPPLLPRCRARCRKAGARSTCWSTTPAWRSVWSPPSVPT